MSKHYSTLFNEVVIGFLLLEVLSIMLIGEIRYLFFQRFVDSNVKRLHVIDAVRRNEKRCNI